MGNPPIAVEWDGRTTNAPTYSLFNFAVLLVLSCFVFFLKLYIIVLYSYYYFFRKLQSRLVESISTKLLVNQTSKGMSQDPLCRKFLCLYAEGFIVRWIPGH